MRDAAGRKIQRVLEHPVPLPPEMTKVHLKLMRRAGEKVKKGSRVEIVGFSRRKTKGGEIQTTHFRVVSPGDADF